MKIPRQLTFWTALSRITGPFISAYYFFEDDLSPKWPSLAPAPDFCVRFYCGATDIPAAIDVLVPAGLTTDDVTARLQRGDLVAVGFLGGQPAAYTWASFTEANVKELGRMLRARLGEVIQYDTLVLKPFRRRGLQFALNHPARDYLRQRGYTRTLSWVNALNRPSCKNQRKWGKKVLLTAIILEVPGIRRRWIFGVGAPLASIFSGREPPSS